MGKIEMMDRADALERGLMDIRTRVQHPGATEPLAEQFAFQYIGKKDRRPPCRRAEPQDCGA
jgi:hypothetical protein